MKRGLRYVLWACFVGAPTTRALLAQELAPVASVSSGGNGGGSIVGWGSQVVGVDLARGFVAVAAGYAHSLGLKGDGSIVAWGAGGPGLSGYRNYGQSIVALRQIC